MATSKGSVIGVPSGPVSTACKVALPGLLAAAIVYCSVSVCPSRTSAVVSGAVTPSLTNCTLGPVVAGLTNWPPLSVPLLLVKLLSPLYLAVIACVPAARAESVTEASPPLTFTGEP